MFWRTFGVHLSTRELGALISYFDRDGDGMVDSTEFVTWFFNLKLNSEVVNPSTRKSDVYGYAAAGGSAYSIGSGSARARARTPSVRSTLSRGGSRAGGSRAGGSRTDGASISSAGTMLVMPPVPRAGN